MINATNDSKLQDSGSGPSPVSTVVKNDFNTSGAVGTQAASTTQPAAVNTPVAKTAPPIQKMPDTPKISDTPSPLNSDNNSRPSKPKKKKFDVKMIAGVFALLLIILGAGAGFFLSQQSQDLRQQAYPLQKATLPCSPTSQGHCSEGCNETTWHCNPTEQETADGYVDDPTQDIDPDPTMTGEFGECYGLASDEACIAELSKDDDAAADPNVEIRGTYVNCNDGPTSCKRYVIDLPSTHEAAVEYSIVHGDTLNLYNPDGSGDKVDLEPRKICNTSGLVDYNEYDCTDTSGDGTVREYCPPGFSTGDEECYNVYYFGPTDYEDLVADGETWVSYATGCNDGVHDRVTDDNFPEDTNFQGDCDVWHWTVCLDEGSGVNGYGCGEEPPDNPPGEETPPPTAPPGCNDACTADTQCSDMNANWFCDPTSSNCRLEANPISTTCEPVVIPGEPMCKDVAVLENGVEINPATASFSIGMVLQFRCAADDLDSQVTNYEFQVTEPDGTIIDGVAINPAGTSATSLEYQIDQYLEHQVQCRVCTGDGCQEWISVVQ